MTVNDTPQPQGAEARTNRSILARSALLAGGATTGLVASALAGFGLVGLMFPNSGLPGTGGAPLTAAAYLPVPVEVTVMPETRVARVEPAPVLSAPVLSAPVLSAPDGLATPTAPAAPQVELAPEAPVRPVPSAEAEITVAAVTPPARTATEITPPPHGAAARPETIVATKSAPAETTDALTAPGIDTSSFGPRITALPEDARPDPAATATTQPETFAILADEDAATRSGAGLFADEATARAPQEAVTPDATGQTAAVAPVRPAPRPEAVPATLAAVEPAVSDAAPTRSIRPAPRPEIRLAAATTAPAPAEIAAPTNVVEVAAHQGGGGFFSGGSSACGRSLARAMPSRKGGATGSAFFAGLTNVSGPDRDGAAIAELARGNMPAFLRNLQPVTFQGQDARGADVEITICVTPDYLALGSDTDYVRVPLGLPAAARIAGAFDMTLPTPRMVDAIYAQARVKLSPSPMTPGAQMSTTNYFVTHNATIEGQLQGRGGLVAGHKKDVVMASRMASAPGRVAIYGWHQRGGAPIQPVSTVHGANYADYSHGIRLVSKTAYLNGKAVSLDDLLSSSRYAYLLNDDGPMPGPVIRTASN